MRKADQGRSVITFSVLAACLCVMGAREASAQATLTGKVVSEAGAPLTGASVSIPSLGVGTTTNDRGTYLLNVSEQNAKSQQVVVSARFIGFTPQRVPLTLTPGSHVLDFTLKPDPFRLEGVVVTGVAESTSVKKLTFSVGQVTADQVKDVPAANPIAALAGKVAGAKIELGVGNPGSDPAIRLRGSTNLTVGASAPLIIVDGVILRDVNRNSISDIDAQDIESIEVLKGAAASSFYGSDAANGVINITMKRGRNLPDNHVSVTARTEYGQSGIPHWISLNHSHDYVLNSDGTIQLVKGSRVVETDQIADNPYPTSGPGAWRNQLKTWLGNNSYYNND